MIAIRWGGVTAETTRVLRDIAEERVRAEMQPVDLVEQLRREVMAHYVLDWAWGGGQAGLRRPVVPQPAPEDRRRDLIEAASLIVAEIERIDRLDAADSAEHATECRT